MTSLRRPMATLSPMSAGIICEVEMIRKTALLLAFIMALLSLYACNGLKRTGPSALARTFLSTGIVPGKSLPSDVHVEYNAGLSRYSSIVGETAYTGANLFIELDKDKLVTNASIDAPGKAKKSTGPSNASEKDCLTQDGKSIFTLTEEELKKLYGKPSWTSITDGYPPPTMEVLTYYYRFDPDTLISISCAFEMGGSDKTVSTISAGFVAMKYISDEAKEKAKIYKWSADLRMGIRRPAIES
jgi:hypothetical protein